MQEDRLFSRMMVAYTDPNDLDKALMIIRSIDFP
jgi:hypothetical protein